MEVFGLVSIPIFILLIKIPLKAWFLKKPDSQKSLDTLCDAPADIPFLLLSFIATHAVIFETPKNLLQWVFGLIIMSLVSIFICRENKEALDESLPFYGFTILVLHYVLIFLLMYLTIFEIMLNK